MVMTVKRLLFLLLFSICAIGWRSESIMQMMGMADPIVSPPTASGQSPGAPANGQSGGMSLAEYAELAKTDQAAYRKLFASHQQEPERSALDKLINLFTRLKYE